ncbi:MAG: hypothetical protein AAFY22_12205 [Pseudomonadota bacterium]
MTSTIMPLAAALFLSSTALAACAPPGGARQPAISTPHASGQEAAQPGAPTRFFPAVFKPEGRITLTPGFSPDGTVMYFAQTECAPIWECPQRLKRSVRTETGWSAPDRVALPADPRIEARVDSPSVTPDGAALLFSWSAPRPDQTGPSVSENFDLWRLDLTDRQATPTLLTGPDLNRIREGAVKSLRFVNNETAPNLTVDGDLYFWSERLDATGERDVFLARADGAGGFLKPEPLPAPINSPDRDDGAWVSPDGALMLITYANRGGCGGNDLYIARRINGAWSAPKNLGCKINSPYDEYAASIIPGTTTIVFPSDRPTPENGDRSVQLWQADLTLSENF